MVLKQPVQLTLQCTSQQGLGDAACLLCMPGAVLNVSVLEGAVYFYSSVRHVRWYGLFDMVPPDAACMIASGAAVVCCLKQHNPLQQDPAAAFAVAFTMVVANKVAPGCLDCSLTECCTTMCGR
jgi:hypothetical protein